jgi:hypothetical protein
MITKFVKSLSIYCIMCVWFFSCEAKKEAVMPYYNFGYTANRLLPVSLSNAEFEFRIWINNGTSIDRVISISKSKDYGDQAYLCEIGFLSRKYKTKNFYTNTKITPKSGIDGFIAEIDSMKLSEMQSPPDSSFYILATDRPFSLYVVELKENGKYHCFKFTTSYPYKAQDDKKYDDIQNFIFKEFHFNFYMK